ncbi:hypothetical protein J6590_014459 [Homalodisca vitripennis]|nr:hypothetical protein J6590_014459 [Homalodisca vitripennis]
MRSGFPTRDYDCKYWALSLISFIDPNMRGRSGLIGFKAFVRAVFNRAAYFSALGAACLLTLMLKRT